MNKLELAKKLSGNEYGEEISTELNQIARENNLVVVFGASDDLMEFRGAMDDDEIGCYGEKEVYVNRYGILYYYDEDGSYCNDCPLWNENINKSFLIKAIFDKEGYSWLYETAIPHATFEIMEGGEKYCRGIVFSIDDLEAKDGNK